MIGERPEHDSLDLGLRRDGRSGHAENARDAGGVLRRDGGDGRRREDAQDPDRQDEAAERFPADGGADDSQVARVVSKAISAGKMLKLDYYKPNEDEFTERVVEPYALVNGREGWYVASFDPERDDVRHFRLDRVRHASVSRKQFKRRPEVNPSADVEGWPKTGELPASNTATIWISPERARWAREESTVIEELADGSVLLETTDAGRDWLVREILKEAGVDIARRTVAKYREAMSIPPSNERKRIA